VPGPWIYNERNELTSYNGINFTYDLNGNQRTRSGTPNRVYSWDVENRLDRVSENGTEIAQFEYDPLGRRVVKSPVSSPLTRFAYDGEDILFEQGPSGNFTYLHGPGIDEPLARESSTGVRTYYHADGLGSIVKRTDAAGNVIGTQAYDSFGVGTGLPNGYGFTGREWDGEFGAAFYRARYYDPTIGRFLSEDPIRFRGGLNFFGYVTNNPTNLVDPSGLCACPNGEEPPAPPSPGPSPSPAPATNPGLVCQIVCPAAHENKDPLTGQPDPVKVQECIDSCDEGMDKIKEGVWDTFKGAAKRCWKLIRR
jgi:RHS repeat-associated protein